VDEWGHCSLRVEAVMTVMTGGGGGSRRLLAARIAGDHVDNGDEPRS